MYSLFGESDNQIQSSYEETIKIVKFSYPQIGFYTARCRLSTHLIALRGSVDCVPEIGTCLNFPVEGPDVRIRHPKPHFSKYAQCRACAILRSINIRRRSVTRFYGPISLYQQSFHTLWKLNGKFREGRENGFITRN